MKIAILLGIFAAVTLPAVDEAEVARRLKLMGPHPRLFLDQEAGRKLAQSTTAHPLRAAVRSLLLRRAEAMLSEKPVQRILIGRRLLDKSRTCLSRVLHLSLAWRLTGERKYADRARQEMLAAAAFADWNPSHFLDVAEMTAALGIGYDWLYPILSEDDRRTIREAIVEKGLKPSLTVNGWTRAVHNWNQVCNAGMAIGAIAVAESEPALAAQMVARAINTVPAAMHEYGPDGAYPEGTSYWGYGTSFNVLLIDALQSALGSDFGLIQTPGFLATADYMLHVYGPTDLPFSYSDAGTRPAGPIPAMFWFAAARREPYLLWSEWRKLGELAKAGEGLRGDRLDPFLLIWWNPDMTRTATPPALSWTGRGQTPVAFHRSSWEPNATYAAIKGGSPSVNHAHMDIGSYVIDAGGTRWADDLGMQDYNSLESKGIALWGRNQDSERWKVFRLGTSAHSVLMVNGEQQRVEGNAPVISARSGSTVLDLAEVYRGQLSQARRGIRLLPDGAVLVQDELTPAGAGPAKVRWAMVTKADVRVDGPGRATLTRDGRTLRFQVVEPAGAALRIYSTDPPPAETDAPNPGTRILGFEITAAPGEAQRIAVHLALEPAPPAAADLRPLSRW